MNNIKITELAVTMVRLQGNIEQKVAEAKFLGENARDFKGAYEAQVEADRLKAQMQGIAETLQTLGMYDEVRAEIDRNTGN